MLFQRRVTYEYDAVGNRGRRIIEETDANGERAVKVTNYTYDERDRLVAERSAGETLYLGAAAGDPRQLATLQRPPQQRVFEHALSGLFGLATLGLVLGFVWPRSTHGRLGKSARRKQLFTSAVAIFLVPLMGVDLSILADLNVHAWQRAALADVRTLPADDWCYDRERTSTKGTMDNNRANAAQQAGVREVPSHPAHDAGTRGSNDGTGDEDAFPDQHRDDRGDDGRRHRRRAGPGR